MLTLLLDLDGTLTDPYDGIAGCLRHALQSLGEIPPDDRRLALAIGPPLVETFAEILRAAPDSERVALAIERYSERFDELGWRENRLIPGVPALLDAAGERGWRRLIVTSKPRALAERIAHHFDLRRRLEGVYGAERDGSRGAKPELVARVLASERIAPSAAVMLGDRHHDVMGARSNGIASIGVTWGYGSRDELLAAGADHVCDDPGAVLTTLHAIASRVAGSPASLPKKS